MPCVPSLLDDSLVTDADDGLVPVELDGPTHTTCAPFPGERIGRYLLQDKLAQGTFGLVFRAFDLELDRLVALKILNPDHATRREIVDRFLREAAATARVVHPGVVTVLDCGRHGDTAYIAMDLLEGESLTDHLQRCGRLLPHDAVELARQIAAALEAAHAAGVLHRDLKPDNIFLVHDPACGDGLRVKILDFGLARIEDATRPRRTLVHSLLGTPRYMSPEQCRSSPDVDHRADIYALGCILFEMVTGAVPYSGEIHAVLQAHVEAPIPRASTFCACSPQLDALIARLLAKDPARRAPTMTDVRRALDMLPAGRLGSSPSITATPTAAMLPAIMRPARPGSEESTTRTPPLDGARAPRRASLPPPRRPHAASAPPLHLPRGITAPPAPTTPSRVPPRAATTPPPPPRAARGTAPPPPEAARPCALEPRPVAASRPHNALDSGPRRVRSADTRPSSGKLPPYFPQPPVARSPVVPPTPVPVRPSMSTAMGLAMAYVPPPGANAPSLHHPVAVPIGLPVPTSVARGAAVPEPSMLPVILVAIACALAGALGALLIS